MYVKFVWILIAVALMDSIFGSLAQYDDMDYPGGGDGRNTAQEESPEKQWIQREGTKDEYRFHTDQKDFDGANTECGLEDSKLVSIHSETENLWIHQRRSQSDSQWIGITKFSIVGKGDDGWLWIDRTPKSYIKWGRRREGEDCAAFTDKKDESRWYSYRCTRPRQYICKRTLGPCTPNPCPDHEECVPDGSDYECVCHDCPSGAEEAFAHLAKNKMLLVLMIVGLIIATIVVLVIVCSCIRGCLESSKRNKKISRKTKEKLSLMEQENQASEDTLCEKKSKPDLPPKPNWKRDQSKTSPSLSDSARGRSQSEDESEASDSECRKVAIELHHENERASDSRPPYARPLSME